MATPRGHRSDNDTDRKHAEGRLGLGHSPTPGSSRPHWRLDRSGPAGAWGPWETVNKFMGALLRLPTDHLSWLAPCACCVGDLQRGDTQVTASGRSSIINQKNRTSDLAQRYSGEVGKCHS